MPRIGTKSFDSKYSLLREIWVNEGVEADIFHEGDLSSLSESSLKSIRASLLNSKTINDGEMNDLIDIYVKLIDTQLKINQAAAFNDSIDESVSPCSNIALFENVLTEKENLLALLMEYYDLVDEYQKTYVEQAKAINLNRISPLGDLVDESRIDYQKEMIEAIRSGCST